MIAIVIVVGVGFVGGLRAAGWALLIIAGLLIVGEIMDKFGWLD